MHSTWLLLAKRAFGPPLPTSVSCQGFTKQWIRFKTHKHCWPCTISKRWKSVCGSWCWMPLLRMLLLFMSISSACPSRHWWSEITDMDLTIWIWLLNTIVGFFCFCIRFAAVENTPKPDTWARPLLGCNWILSYLISANTTYSLASSDGGLDGRPGKGMLTQSVVLCADCIVYIYSKILFESSSKVLLLQPLDVNMSITWHPTASKHATQKNSH